MPKQYSLTLDDLLKVTAEFVSVTAKRILVSENDYVFIEKNAYRPTADSTVFEKYNYGQGGVTLVSSRWIPEGICAVEHSNGKLEIIRLYEKE